MYLRGTHRSISRRLRLALAPGLGAGNFFWHACRVAGRAGLDRPVLHRRGPQGTREWSLRELREVVARYAAFHAAHGARPGSRIGVYTADGLTGLLHHIAITALGGATVLANPKMPGEVATHYFAATDTTFVVGDRERLALLGGLDPAIGTADVLEVDAPARLPRLHRHAASDLVLVSHSSGTTGVPKPTEFGHRSFFVGKRERLWNFPSRRADRLLTALPQSHSAGISYVSLALLLGLPTLMLDDAADGALAAAMNEFEPTVVIGFPISLAELEPDALTERAAARVHTWMGMGDASHERHIRPLVQVGRRPDGRRGSTYVDGLGSSEMGMVLFRVAHTPETDNYGRLIGKPVKVVREAAALDERGNALPPGRAGLLGVRTPSTTPGYVNAPDLNERSWSGGYFLTGDVVRQDEQGNFYHLDRTPDVIPTRTGPVYSLEAEEVVLVATGAFDCAVVAVDDPDAPGHSAPAGVVLFADGEHPSADELLAACNEALTGAGLTALRALVVAGDRDGLPVGVTGKVLKRLLRERHADVLSGPPSSTVALADVTRSGGR
jgi:long-chain acyl-CoA synthetase